MIETASPYISTTRSAFDLAADILDPPTWEPADRPPLEPHQRPPDGPWSTWLLEAGRGSGKTEACARYFAAYMRANPGHRGRIIAPTYGDAVESCIQGPSGLKAIDPEVRWVPGDPGGSKVFWPNGSQALVFGTPHPADVDRFRAGGNRHIDWWTEMAANTQLEDGWDQAQLGLRLGDHPHTIADTTPRYVPGYRRVRNLVGVVRTHATMFDNPHNPPEWVAAMRKRYEGTRLGRQELLGHLIEDVEGALWMREWLDKGRVARSPSKGYRVLVIGLDPSDGLEAGAEQAWVLAGLGLNHQLYVAGSGGQRVRPLAWLKDAIGLAREEGATLIVEKNHGGQYLVGLLEVAMRELGVRAPYQMVTASQGKTTRAEPVALLYEQGASTGQPIIHHIGEHLELEDQMCNWTGEQGEKSPDRMDALVWAITYLMGYSRKPKGFDSDKAVPWQESTKPGSAVPWR